MATKDHFPDWKDYEKQILKLLREVIPDADKAKFIWNDKITGKHSERPRQIDVSVRHEVGGKKCLTIVECKHLGKKVDVTKVDALAGKMQDVQADYGFIYTSMGYTSSAERSADSRKNIGIIEVPYEYLKDYAFVTANSIDEFALQELEYKSIYCDKCEKTNMYEIKIVRGFADFDDPLICPQCKSEHKGVRTDGGYKIIKRFDKKKVSEIEYTDAIIQNALATRHEWDRLHSFDGEFLQTVPKELKCRICSKLLDREFPGTFSQEYKKHKICLECMQSRRTLLIDHKVI